MSYIDNVEENAFLNRLNWNILSCHDKALCVVAESLKKNASLFFILFKLWGRDYLRRHYDLGIGDREYYDFVGNLCGIHLERKYGKKNDFFKTIKILADTQQHCVLMINTKYQAGARLVGKKDHPHFMAYQGYDGDGFCFIDEDWSRQYWKTKEVDDVIYCCRKICPEELITMAGSVNACNIFADQDSYVPDGDYFLYYLLTKTNDTPCDLSVIKTDFIQQLTFLVENYWPLMNYARDQMDTFTANLSKYRNEMVLNVRKRLTEDERKEDELAMKEQITKARTDELFAIRTRFIYPCESEILGAYADFLYMLRRILLLRTTEFPAKEKVLKQIQILIDSFEYVKWQIARSVILGEADLTEEAWKRYVQLNKKSMTVYKTLIRETWEISEYNE